MQKLVDEGVFLKGNYSKKLNDRTSWYAFYDEDKFLGAFEQKADFQAEKPFAPEGKCNCPNGQMDLPKRANGFAPEGKCIKEADNYTDNNTDSYLKKSDSELSVGLLVQNGISRKVARSIVSQGTTYASVKTVIQNGLARQDADPDFHLQPGYIVRALNQARAEGKSIKPTKFTQRLKGQIAKLRHKGKLLDKSEFEQKRNSQLTALRSAL